MKKNTSKDTDEYLDGWMGLSNGNIKDKIKRDKTKAYFKSDSYKKKLRYGKKAKRKSNGNYIWTINNQSHSAKSASFSKTKGLLLLLFFFYFIFYISALLALWHFYIY